MIRVMKSPNMMSTTGRNPVIAAPTPMPVKPGSEIGVLITRSLPNSSARPVSTLNAVPASATSSPITTTSGSRRISSASASFTAWPSVNSRTCVSVSGIHVLCHFTHDWIRSLDGKIHSRLHLRFDVGFDAVELGLIGEAFADHPFRQTLDGIARLLPLFLFFLGAVVIALDVADVMAAVAIGVAKNEPGAFPLPRALDKCGGGSVDAAHILAVHGFRGNPKGCRPRQNLACRGVLV